MGAAFPNAGSSAGLLCQILRTALGAPHVFTPAEQKELEALYARAEAKWPKVRLDPQRFVSHLCVLLQSVAPEEAFAVLTERHIEDLYLACACLAHDAGAISTFEGECLAPVDRKLRASGDRAFADEVMSVLRERLLVGSAGGAPKLATYGGRGPLGAWVRVIAARVRVDLRRITARRREVPIGGNAKAADDPERDYVLEHYRPELRAAFVAAVAALEPRERSLLRLHYVEGMSTRALGGIYKVDARSVQRWLLELRAKLLTEVEREAMARGLDGGSGLRSMVRSLDHDFDIGISEVMRLREAPAR